jgi:hypothetical protein
MVAQMERLAVDPELKSLRELLRQAREEAGRHSEE